jgi:hypothetical protein
MEVRPRCRARDRGEGCPPARLRMLGSAKGKRLSRDVEARGRAGREQGSLEIAS